MKDALLELENFLSVGQNEDSWRISLSIATLNVLRSPPVSVPGLPFWQKDLFVLPKTN